MPENERGRQGSRSTPTQGLLVPWFRITGHAHALHADSGKKACDAPERCATRGYEHRGLHGGHAVSDHDQQLAVLLGQRQRVLRDRGVLRAEDGVRDLESAGDVEGRKERGGQKRAGEVERGEVGGRWR